MCAVQVYEFCVCVCVFDTMWSQNLEILIIKMLFDLYETFSQCLIQYQVAGYKVMSAFRVVYVCIACVLFRGMNFACVCVFLDTIWSQSLGILIIKMFFDLYETFTQCLIQYKVAGY